MNEELRSRLRTVVSYLLAVMFVVFVGGMAFLTVRMIVDGF